MVSARKFELFLVVIAIIGTLGGSFGGAYFGHVLARSPEELFLYIIPSLENDTLVFDVQNPSTTTARNIRIKFELSGQGQEFAVKEKIAFLTNEKATLREKLNYRYMAVSIFNKDSQRQFATFATYSDYVESNISFTENYKISASCDNCKPENIAISPPYVNTYKLIKCGNLMKADACIRTSELAL